MSELKLDRDALEELWQLRLSNAKLRLEFARNYVLEVQRDRRAEVTPPRTAATPISRHFAPKPVL
jgi:hypothetical protein